MSVHHHILQLLLQLVTDAETVHWKRQGLAILIVWVKPSTLFDAGNIKTKSVCQVYNNVHLNVWLDKKTQKTNMSSAYSFALYAVSTVQ